MGILPAGNNRLNSLYCRYLDRSKAVELLEYDLVMVSLHQFHLCPAAAALWYLFPQLMVWPLLLGLLPWLLRLGHEGRWRWRTPFDWPFLLFLLTGLVSLWAAYNRELAWAKFWTIVAGMLLFYALGAFFSA